VAYKGSKTGRLFERGGGMQNMPKHLKKMAYAYVFDTHNYDIRSCHLAIIAQLCREEGHVLPMLDDYMADKQAKHDWAKNAHMPVELWKACLLSLFFGAALGKSKKASLYRDVWEFLEKHGDPYTAEDIDRHYENFIRVGVPFIEARKTWIQVLKAKLIPKMTYNKNFLVNHCGATMFIPDKWTPAEIREVASFVTQGLESAFINHLMLLSKEYGWINRSIEHDGLVTTGRISQEAIAKARHLSGFYTALLEEEKHSLSS
jgi:hypothetical protein